VRTLGAPAPWGRTLEKLREPKNPPPKIVRILKIVNKKKTTRIKNPTPKKMQMGQIKNA